MKANYNDKFIKFEISYLNDGFVLNLVNYIVVGVDEKLDRCTLLNEFSQKFHTEYLELDQIKEKYSTNLLDAYEIFEKDCKWRINNLIKDYNQYIRCLDEALEQVIK